MSLKTHFEDHGYAIGEKIFSDDDLRIFKNEFNRILDQLILSGENINAKWGSSLTSDVEPENSKVIHTHNVQSYSSAFLSMIQNETWTPTPLLKANVLSDLLNSENTFCSINHSKIHYILFHKDLFVIYSHKIPWVILHSSKRITFYTISCKALL